MSDARQIANVLDAPWLPPGSSAEVWVGDDCRAPHPAIVTRLLLLKRNSSGELEFFCVPTPKGPNLPTRYLFTGTDRESSPEGASSLMCEVFGRADLPTRCIGFVRNVVPTPAAGYTYPSPWAHVPVFLVTDTAAPIVDGAWFGAGRGQSELSDRHWWPIVKHYLARQAD
jgi:hypothetical protein